MLELNSFPTNTKHFHFISFTCLSLIFNLCKAQSSMEPVPTYITHHSWEPSVAITVGAIIIALLLMGIISLYLRRCAESHIIITTTTTTTVPCSCSQGINKELLNTFPTLFYSNIKDLKKGTETLECAVCLTDFTDKDALRLLPKCNHVFHPHCIDSWLASHVTCPVCRANLSQESCHVSIAIPTEEETTPAQVEQNDANQVCIGDHVSDTTKIMYINEEQLSQSPNNEVNQVCIEDPILTTSEIPNNDASQACIRDTKTVYINEEQLSPSSNNDISQVCIGDPTVTADMTKIVYINEEQPSSYEVASGVELDSNTSSTTDIDDGVIVSERNFSRSNSTGHSLAEQGKGVERYTLRLPEDVRRYILVNHGRSVQRSASVKGVCWSDKEDSFAGKRVEKRWMICTPPFVARHG